MPGGGGIPGRVDDVDALRGIAALLVVANHASLMGALSYAESDRHPAALALHGTGAGGVSLFFALSGFLIAGPYLAALLEGRAGPDVRRYARRRMTRILPAYWIALTAAILLLTPAAGL